MKSLPKSTLKASILALLQEPGSVRPLAQAHALLLTSGLTRDPFVVVELTKSYALANCHLQAYEFIKRTAFDHRQDPFHLNSIISVFADGGGGVGSSRLAVSVYKHFVGSGFLSFPDRYTFPTVLKCCARFSGGVEGRQVHAVVCKMGVLLDLYVQNGLVHLYGVCGGFADARCLFDEMAVRDVVSWTGLISGYVKGGFFEQALGLFVEMDLEPNVATLVSVLVACGRLGATSVGRSIHGFILKRGSDIGLVVGNALLDMYVKFGCLDEAKRVFKELSCRDILSWTSMISGLSQCNRPKEALEVFHDMQECGVEPDKITLASVLSACASLGALVLGRWVHDYIDRKGLEWDVHLGTAMVDMYSKNGCIETAFDVFEKLPCKNLLSWNALLGGLALHGHGKATLTYYNRMVGAGFVPNEVTFLAVLNACCHSGLVQEGRLCFNSMTKAYNLEPRIEHYGCMVDLLGKAGLLEEAYDLIRSMPMEADILIWGALLSACKAQGNVELSKQIQNYLLEMEASDSGVYVLLSNIYATNGRWRDVTKTRILMKQMGIKKEPGSSVIELNGKTHEFLMGNMGRPFSNRGT